MNSITLSTGDSKTTTTGDKDNGQSKETGWSGSVTTNSTVNKQTQKYVNADFIKYTQ